MALLERISTGLNKALLWVAGIFLVGMVILTCANILLRLCWVPVRGTFEMMGLSGALVAAFALGYTQVKGGHIAVDVLTSAFPEGTRRFLHVLNGLVGLVFFALVAWQVAQKARTLWAAGEVTETLRIAYYPFIFAVGLGCAALALSFLTDLVRDLFPKGGARP